MSNDNTEDVRSRQGASGVVFVGCFMLGLAVGLFLNSVAVGVLGGLGLGFVGMGVVRALTGEW